MYPRRTGNIDQNPSSDTQRVFFNESFLKILQIECQNPCSNTQVCTIMESWIKTVQSLTSDNQGENQSKICLIIIIWNKYMTLSQFWCRPWEASFCLKASGFSLSLVHEYHLRCCYIGCIDDNWIFKDF